MSSSKSFARFARQIAFIVGLAGIAGCGYAPIYGTHGSASDLMGSVSFNVDQTAEGYHLRERLVERLGTPEAQAPNQLTVRIATSEKPVAIASNDTTVRTTVTGTADYSFVNNAGETVATGSVRSFEGYSSLGSVVAINAAQQDAYERLSYSLADLIVAQILTRTAGQ
ncbi:hypothetical protein BVC71_06820 [Marivivens niveibacter]|uniref:LPS-assembly lipoprotein n=1 Tax=Marivivens niveibacter TaxID=1930667 RepID=A0A251WYN6_9RHOB|nr:LPS assembly lipoprotein LptE [Marivivens niveibacter]OUD09557.1 hypothetical protein BVC71_06820 [Marivivens niveibacter]